MNFPVFLQGYFKMKGESEMATVGMRELMQSVSNNDEARQKLAHYTVEQWDLHQVFEYAVDVLEEKYHDNSNLFDEDLGFYCESILDDPGYDPARLFPTKDGSDNTNQER